MFPVKGRIVSFGNGALSGNVEMCYSEKVGSVSMRMLLGLDMDGSQSPGFLAAEALTTHEAVSAFSSGQLLNGACSHWGISVSILELRLAFED